MAGNLNQIADLIDQGMRWDQTPEGWNFWNTTKDALRRNVAPRPVTIERPSGMKGEGIRSVHRIEEALQLLSTERHLPPGPGHWNLVKERLAFHIGAPHKKSSPKVENEKLLLLTKRKEGKMKKIF